MSQKSSIARIDTPTQEAEGRQVYTSGFAPRSLYHGHILEGTTDMGVFLSFLEIPS